MNDYTVLKGIAFIVVGFLLILAVHAYEVAR